MYSGTTVVYFHLIAKLFDVLGERSIGYHYVECPLILAPSLAGTIGIIWFLVWSVLAFNSPANHPKISDKERDYIESSIAVKRTAVDKVACCLTSFLSFSPSFSGLPSPSLLRRE